MLKCNYCEKQFVSVRKHTKHCSKSCASSATNIKRYSIPGVRKHIKIEKECFVCKRAYITYESNTKSKCCSALCINKWKSEIYKGRKITGTWLENQSKAKVRENIIKFGDYKCEKCERTFKSNVSLRSHRSYCNNDKELKNVKCEICNKTFKRQRNLIVHLMFKHNVDDQYLKNHCLTVSRACQNRITQKTSKSECEFMITLKKIFGEEVQHKFKIPNVTHEYDFYIPSRNLIIEFDGDYWHGNTKNHILTPNMKKQYHIDQSYTKAAIKAGYSIDRVWESECTMYPGVKREFKHE